MPSGRPHHQTMSPPLLNRNDRSAPLVLIGMGSNWATHHQDSDEERQGQRRGQESQALLGCLGHGGYALLVTTTGFRSSRGS